jgi:P4 family phage/plasmid primase-like protien
MITMAPPSQDELLDQEQVTLTLEEQQRLFQEALREQNQSKLYACIEWLGHLKQHIPVQYALKKIEIKKSFGKTLSIRDFSAVVSAEAHRQQQLIAGTKLDIADVAIQWAHSHHNEWGYDLTTHTWYQWNGTHWQALYEEAGKPSTIDHEAIAAMHSAEIAINSNQALNCFRRVAANYCKRAFHLEQTEKINFANGTLDLTTLTLSPHCREDNFIYCLNYHYDPTGTHPEIDTYLEKTIPDEHARQAYIAHIGLSLIRDTDFHNFTLFIGPPRAGKSTLLAIGNATCGLTEDPMRFAGPSLFLRDLEGKRARAIWVDHRIVAVDELPGEALREEELLKLMSAHSGVEMRRIGKDERTDNRWKPKLMMSTNDTPHYKDTSGAIRHRAIVIECPNGPIPDNQQQKNLFPKKLLPEIGAFAHTCILHAQAMKQHGYYPRSAEMKRLLDEIEHMGNPLKAFIRECCVLELTAKTTSDTLHKAYTEYISEGGNSPMAKNKMSSSIRDMHIGVVVGEWMRFNGRPSRCLKGIRLRRDTDGDPQEPVYQSDPMLFPTRSGSTPENPLLSQYNPSCQGINQEVILNGGEAHQSSMSNHNSVSKPSKETGETLTSTEEAEKTLLGYPLNMSQLMEPPPTEPCPGCKGHNYFPYWGKFATRQWGCGTCHPQISERLGLYNPEDRR